MATERLNKSKICESIRDIQLHESVVQDPGRETLNAVRQQAKAVVRRQAKGQVSDQEIQHECSKAVTGVEKR